jgi:hypothetical protein
MEKIVPFVIQALRRRWLPLAGLGLVMLAAAGVAIWTYVEGAERRSLALARRLTTEGELRRAVLLLEQALQVNPQSVAARRAMAEFSDHLGLPAAIEQWRQVVEIGPSDEARWRWAEAALRHGDLAVAREAILEVSAAGRNGLDHHRLSAALALARGERRAAERHLAAMLAIEPANPRFRFNLAAHRLQDGVEVAAARAELERLAVAGPLRTRATLELMAEATRRWTASADPEAALAARLLDGAPAVDLRARALPGRERLRAHLLAPPYPDAGDAAVVALWLRREEGPAEALAWLAGLPEEVQASPALVALAADCALAARDWGPLEAALRRGAWGPVSPALVGGAFRLRERRERGERNATGWQVLLDDPARSRPGLRLLWRLADAWGWEVEAERALGTVVRRFPGERWAWENLQATLLRRGDSAGLWRHYAAWVRERPGDEGAQLERLMLGFLTGRAEPADRAQAAVVRKARPASPVAAAVHALALRAEGRPDAAVRELPAFAGAAAVEPRLALVRGLLLAENGRTAEARAALARVQEPLLPEERDLLAAARARAGGD